MLRREDVEPRFRALLAEEGVDVDRPSLAAITPALRAMERFATEPVENAVPPEGDGVLLQWGVHKPPDGGEYFDLNLTRQLTFYDGDAYDVMTQLWCSFLFAPTDALRAVREGGEMLEPGEPFADYALTKRGFRAVLEQG